MKFIFLCLIFIFSSKKGYCNDKIIIDEQKNKNNFEQEKADKQEKEKAILGFLPGRAPKYLLILGMWSNHIFYTSCHNNNNKLIAAGIYGIAIGTFINSCGDRSYIAAIDRSFKTINIVNDLNIDFGYRLALVTGYTKKTFALAEHSPVLPVPQLYANIRWKYFALNIQETLYILSVSLSMYVFE